MTREKELIVESTTLTPPLKRISWSAIFIGALVGVGLSFLLNLFGVAIGLSAYSVNNGSTTLAVGGLIGIIIGIIAAMLVAGYAAGYLGRGYCPQRNLGILYGFATWTVALLLSAVVTAHFSQYVQGYTRAVTNTVVVPDNSVSTPSVTVEPKSEDETTQSQVNVKVTPEQLTWASFIIFVLFFIGAFATCVGACWGMSCKRID
ncbi:Uncharacterised protein [Legionella lansingensis]|uniref:Transmembrane protein n=1 Tax=Legionella lansingensis TaxID=45067 RepID=A0A0W0VS03_9GAMM|nr:hypothetical protein [Legionella lansingensis]KTD22872.1 hypothetical protein Llan_0989 [Legionella lansingensis]SNV53712.1 Uncharacterised protein [Legionella lansingensis]